MKILLLLPSILLVVAFQPAPAEFTVPPGLSDSEIQAQIDRLAGLALDDAAKKQIRESLERARAHVKSARQAWEVGRSFSPESLRDRPHIQPASAAGPEPGASSSLKEIEERRSLIQLEVERLQAELADRQRRIEQLPTRREQLPMELKSVQESLTEVESRLESPPPGETRPEIWNAQRTELEARRFLLLQRQAALDSELRQLQVFSDVVSRERDAAEEELRKARRAAALWSGLRDEVQRREREAAEREADRQKEQSSEVDPRLADWARRNVELARRDAELKDLVARAVEKYDQATTLHSELSERLTAAREQGSDLTEAAGYLLRREREQLPHSGHYRRSIRARKQRISEAQIEYQELLSRMLSTEIPEELRRRLQRLAPLAEAETERLRGEGISLLRATEKLSLEVSESLDRYLDRMLKANVAESEVVAVTEEFRSFIDERVLWIRSTVPLWRTKPRNFVDSAGWIVDATAWRRLLDQLAEDVTKLPGVFVPVSLLIVIGTRRWLRKFLKHLGGIANSRANLSFLPTACALVVTLLLAGGPAAVALLLAWRFGLQQDDFSSAIGLGLQRASLVYLTGEVLRVLCRPGGVGLKHFGWSEKRAATIRRNLVWALPVLVFSAFLAATLRFSGNPFLSNTAGRAFFLVGYGTLTLFTLVALRPQHVEGRGLRLTRYPLGSLVLVASLIGLMGLAVSGYYYTARSLSLQFLETSWLALAMIVLWYGSVRWIRLSQKRVLFLRREAKAKEQAAVAESGEEPGKEPTEEESDLGQLSVSARKLLRAALVALVALVLWGIWGEEIPALIRLQQVEITFLHVSLGELLLCGLVLFLGWFFSRHVPALLEIALLHRLGLASGERYAITSVIRYLIGGVSLLVAVSALGLRWSSIQWLVAALGVGLGFGLQEIVANFVSGMILFFERPIRLGDTVTIGDVTGTVTKIRIRATTVTDWDRKEFVVPNKEFVTGRLMNWSLSDSVIRVTVQVGVAYGSDTARAMALLRECAEENTNVLREPNPTASFTQFGDNSLNLVLRCFLPSMEKYMQTISDLHTAVDAKFKKAGIEIAFPQRDIHVRSVVPFPVERKHADAASESVP